MGNSLFLKKVLINHEKISNKNYLHKINAIKNTSTLEFERNITLFSGENGTGKSTLLEAIAASLGFNPEGGTKNYNFKTRSSHSDLNEYINLVKGHRLPKWGYFFRAESFYNVATAEENYAFHVPSRGYHKMSHGESFLRLSEDQFKPNGIYILDEPEAALSPQRQLSLLSNITNCSKDGSQFIIATHSPILLGIPKAHILLFNDSIVETTWEETESYKITKLFIENREGILRNLLE